ncbi:hemerythrin domain-containing protein [Jidongwangia harbinensis]|uniref:hemerythrin domain-containing protein n=1 Tax=Jidongwangia harbinensis TaxID=2878561 RepID=UPI001CD9EB0F|nr:hemerythrin domain-containing protein [Jidongwangia harbinensis]MCA2214680.1 hemerythrin domain-containing protein [Jidongwangia harbinensis]
MADDEEYGRLTALGQQLIETHVRLLGALDDLRDGAPPPRELADHCLAFCAAVTRHHTEEDTSVFPLLAARHPELRDVLDGLERDHRMVAGMLARLAELAQRLDEDGARAELDGLAALLESHFVWEEKRLAGVLDALDPGEWRPRW